MSSSRRGWRPPPGRRWAIWGIGLGAGVLVIAVAVAAALGGDPATSQADTVATTLPDGPQNPAPDIALPNFQGETVRLSDFRGQGLVVNYWASWCLPCLAELPGFEQVYQRHRGEVAFLGINLADNAASALAVAEHTGITYPLAVDREGSSFARFGAITMPTTVFISPDGMILELVSGDLTANELEARLTTYFGR